MALTEAEKKAHGIWRDSGDVQREGRLGQHMQGMDAALGQQAAARMDARARRIDANRQIALGEPGRFSAQFTNWARQTEQQRGLQAHELSMLERQGANDRALQEIKNVGMREQGMEAARLNGESAQSLERIRGKNALDLADQQAKALLEHDQDLWKSQENVANIKAAGEQKTAEIGADASDYAADAKVREQEMRNQGLKEQADIERANLGLKQGYTMDQITLRGKLRQANQAELSMVQRMKRNPRYKDLTESQLLAIIRSDAGGVPEEGAK